jgi:lipid A 3-O-deacylase PagL
MIGRVHFAGSMRVFSLQVLRSLVFLGMLSTMTLAQSSSGPSAALSLPPLRRGTNEFGIWCGYSPFSFVFKGTSKDRQLFLLNLQYARTLLATPVLTLKYNAELVPVALEFQPTQRYQVNGKLLINPGGTIYGGGANPLGVQGNFGHRKIQPFATGSLGFLYFKQQVPILGSSQFNYNITIGFGAQFFPRSGRSLIAGWRYHHLSNNYQARFNPGIDSGVFYLGFSIFRARK